MPKGVSPVPVVPLGRVACAAMPWRERGLLRVSAIAKATFAFAPDAPMRKIDPIPIFSGEVHHQDNPTRSISACSDLVPELGRSEVMLTGHAHAPHGTTATRVEVRLVLRGSEGALIDKTLHIIGDRDKGEPAPFRQMPLIYERAYGGIGYRENPLGVGVSNDGKQPNIVDPTDPRKVAGFGPISRTWSARKGMLTTEQRASLNKSIMDIPEAFDFRYFQSAPEDQRVDYLEGSEWLMLFGMHPELPWLATQLPGMSARARFYGPSLERGSQLVALNADTLRIDADEGRCSITWRGSLELSDDKDLAELWVAMSVAAPGTQITWPTEPPRKKAAAAQEAKPKTSPVSTVVMGDGDVDETTSRLQRIPRTTMTTQLPTELLKITGTQRRALDSTVELSAAASAVAGRPDALPFKRSAAPDKPVPPPAKSQPIPGSPWANEAAPSPPLSSSRYEQTLDILEVEEIEPEGQDTQGVPNVPAPAPAPAPVPAPAPAPVAVAVPAPVVVSVAAPEPAPARAAAPPPVIPKPSPSRPAMPDLKGDLYKKFSKKK